MDLFTIFTSADMGLQTLKFQWEMSGILTRGGKYPSPKINEALSTGTIEVVWNVSSLAISSRSFNWYAQTQRFQHVMNQYPLSTPYFT